MLGKKDILNTLSLGFNQIKSLLIPKTDLEKRIDDLKINQALQLSVLHLNLKKEEILQDIKKSEFKVFSQWGDDGIINFLVNYLDIDDKSFVEFGVESYTECNTKLLLLTHNWRGLIMDGSKNYMDGLRSSQLYWSHNITVLDKFITAENINEILTETGFTGDVGLFHIDIDGNDYWIWKNLEVVRPIIVIVEYNSVFGEQRAITTPYKPDFFRGDAHYSNLYYGVSILALCDLAEEKGYAFIGCNTNGNNAYFVRKDKLKDLQPKTAIEGYVKSQFSESRNEDGTLSYLRDEKRIDLLKGLEVFNTRTNQLEQI